MLRHLILVLALLGSSATRLDAQTPAHLEAARTLIDLLHLPDLVRMSTEAMIEQQIAANPELESFRDLMVTWAGTHLAGESAMKAYAAMYAAQFSEPELRQLSEFYRTSLGQKLVSKQTLLFTAGAEIGERLAEEHQDELVQLLEERAQLLEAAGTPIQ